MNAQRRKALKAIIEQLETMDALRQEAMEMLEEIRDEETEALASMPESLQESARGCQMQEYIGSLDIVLDDLSLIDVESMMDQLQEIVDG